VQAAAPAFAPFAPHLESLIQPFTVSALSSAANENEAIDRTMHNIKQTENALRIELNPPDGIADFDAVACTNPSLINSQRPHPRGETNFLGS
jgi:hypothetical protein